MIAKLVLPFITIGLWTLIGLFFGAPLIGAAVGAFIILMNWVFQ